MRSKPTRTFYRATKKTIVEENDFDTFTATVMRWADGRDYAALFDSGDRGHSNVYVHNVDEVQVIGKDNAVTIKVTGPNRGPCEINLLGVSLLDLARAVTTEQTRRAELNLETVLDGGTQ